MMSKTLIFSLFKNMICRILICLTAQKIVLLKLPPCVERTAFKALFQYTSYEHRRFANVHIKLTFGENLHYRPKG